MRNMERTFGLVSLILLVTFVLVNIYSRTPWFENASPISSQISKHSWTAPEKTPSVEQVLDDIRSVQLANDLNRGELDSTQAGIIAHKDHPTHVTR